MSPIQNMDFGGVNIDFVKPETVNSNVSVSILFVHGMCGNSGTFKNWLIKCAEAGINAYALNMEAIDGTTFDDYVEQVSFAIKFIGPVILVGHSLGGLISQKAASFEYRVKRLVLVASVPPRGIIHISKFWFQWRYIKAALTGKLFTIREQDARRYIFNEIKNSVEIFSKFKPGSGRILREMIFGIWIRKIDVPVLVISGGMDQLIPYKVQLKIVDRYKAEFYNFLLGHMIPIEDPGRVIREILKWCHSDICQPVAKAS
jgi:pimeloyl-ACP methyl ester carboxylesterase